MKERILGLLMLMIEKLCGKTHCCVIMYGKMKDPNKREQSRDELRTKFIEMALNEIKQEEMLRVFGQEIETLFKQAKEEIDKTKKATAEA